jgi:hypothetical protein
MGALFMQKVQQLILNPESCSLTVFPLPGMMSSGCSTQCTVIPEARLQARNASDSGNTICKDNSLNWINSFLSSPLIDSLDRSQVQTKVFPRQPRAYSSAILAQFIHQHLSTIKDLLWALALYAFYIISLLNYWFYFVNIYQDISLNLVLFFYHFCVSGADMDFNLSTFGACSYVFGHYSTVSCGEVC